MLFKCIDLLAKRILCYEAIVINGENILLLRNHKPKAPANRVLEPDTGCFRPQDPIDIVVVVEPVVETLRNFNGPRWISILNDDEVVRWKNALHISRESRFLMVGITISSSSLRSGMLGIDPPAIDVKVESFEFDEAERSGSGFSVLNKCVYLSRRYLLTFSMMRVKH